MSRHGPRFSCNRGTAPTTMAMLLNWPRYILRMLSWGSTTAIMAPRVQWAVLRLEQPWPKNPRRFDVPAKVTTMEYESWARWGLPGGTTRAFSVLRIQQLA